MVAPLIATAGISALESIASGIGQSLDAAASALNSSKATKASAKASEKAKAASQDFEAVFLNSMFQQMFTDTGGDGPMSSKGATGVWRSFLTDEYARNFARAGGVGIAQQVYSSLLAQQEVGS